jgi:hypothetical protein
MVAMIMYDSIRWGANNDVYDSAWPLIEFDSMSQVDGVTHSGPSKMVLYFTGATNILYTFGGHAVTV